MAIIKVQVNACKCEFEQCGHIWLPHNNDTLPNRCAKCKKLHWNNRKARAHSKSLDVKGAIAEAKAKVFGEK